MRGRIERVLDFAKVRGFREGENPARWRGHLDHLLPSKSKVKRVEHHAALPYGEIGAFMAELGHNTASRALRFLILTAARTGEVMGATGARSTLPPSLDDTGAPDEGRPRAPRPAVACRAGRAWFSVR